MESMKNINREEKINLVRKYVKLKRKETENQLKAIRKIVFSNSSRRLKAEKLVKSNATGDWSMEAALKALDTNCHCEYCGKYMLASPDNYKDWQEDHIQPKSKLKNESEKVINDPDNLAQSCRQCNVNFKSRASIKQMKKYVEENCRNDS